MKRMILERTLSAALLIGGPIMGTSALAQSQGGYGPGMMGGYGGGWMGGWMGGGMWIPVLLVVAVAGLVAWIFAQKKK